MTTFSWVKSGITKSVPVSRQKQAFYLNTVDFICNSKVIYSRHITW